MAALLTRLLNLRRTLRSVISPIEACLEVPTPGERVTDAISVSGWAFSRGVQVTEVLASVDGAAAVALSYGIDRLDVAAIYAGSPPLQCGFAGVLPIDAAVRGPAILRVRITDAKGHRRELRSSISIGRVRLVVDVPEPNSANGSAVAVRGWAFSRTTKIVEVYARIGHGQGTALPYGTRRPDVASAYGALHVDRCGFEGVVDSEAVATAGADRLVVRATDDAGETAEVEVPVRLVRRGQAVCEIERAELIGNQLEIDGWVAWPESVPPRVLRVSLGSVLVGATSLNRSRPDISYHFPGYPAGSVRGFRFVENVDSQLTLPGMRLDLGVEAVDCGQRRLDGSTTVVPKSHAGALVSRAVALQVETAIARVRDRLEREPAVLDWHSGLPRTTVSGGINFSPPTVGGQTLPYLDETIDLVIVRAGDPDRVDEARRVACVATVEIGSESKVSGANIAALLWRPGAPPEPDFPATSIIIPVHNQPEHTDACLARVIATLPHGFRGEILVVDDGSSDQTAGMLKRWAETSSVVRVVRNQANAGFVRSCNRGAEEATGQFLVFLNNDTLPMAGWLPPLIRLLRDDPAVGTVGGKLLNHDGTLQEAGAVIFSDGSGYNFGRNDGSPNAPLYSYVRDVDYCSGALLAIRRDLFLDLGGFDIRFAPAYYEDADLCFRLRDKGYRICFQPESVVIHIEGASSGTDEGSGVKRYQAVNRETFVDRWREALTSQPLPPSKIEAARHALAARGNPKHALVCAPRMPEFDREGGSQRVLHAIELLQLEGWAVSFVALDASDAERYGDLLRRRGVTTYAGPESVGAGDDYLDSLDDLIAPGRFDLAIVAFWEAAERIIPRIRALSPTTRIIVDSIDLHFLRMSRAVVVDARLADDMAREISTYASADGVLAVSQREADLINDMTGTPALSRAVPLLEDLPWLRGDFASRRGLLFIGNFRHAPNIEGLTFLCEQVLPRLDPHLRAAHPLCVVGNGVTEAVREIVEGVPHLQLVGWVPSLVPYLERARVSVVPLLHGAGTKAKLIQALMAGTPTVSTPVGVEGLDLEDGRDVLVAGTPEAFAARTADLLSNPALWDQLVTQGRASIERVHSRAAVRARLRTFIDDVMSKPATHVNIDK